MDWILTIFSGENSAVTLVVIVVGLALALVLLAWVFRKIAGDGSLKAGRNRQPRLSVTDAAIVDDKRRLVLVRRDNVEHLVMIGGPTDIVVEQNISRIAPAHHAAEPAARSRTEPRRQPAPAAKPVQQPALEAEEAMPEEATGESAAVARHAEQYAQPARATQYEQQAQAASQLAELELSEEQLAAEIAASEEMTAAEAAAETGAANGYSAASEVAEAEIEIDLAELQSEIDRSQQDGEPEPVLASTKDKVPAPSLDAAELEKLVPERKPTEKAGRAETRQEPTLSAEPANRSTSRVKNMEDEMQRLLEELSGPARN